MNAHTLPSSASPAKATIGFFEWRAMGYRDLLPVVPPDALVSPSSHVASGKGKSPGKLYPNGLWAGLSGWSSIQATEADLAEWQGSGASIGLRFGEAWMLDLDIYDQSVADEVETAALADLGPAPMRVGQWPKRALLYRNDGTVRPQRLRFAGRDGAVNLIEIPPQSVVTGIHPKTGRAYDWRRPPVALDHLSIVSADKLASFLKAMKAKLPLAAIEGASDAATNQATLRDTRMSSLRLWHACRIRRGCAGTT